MNEYLLLAAFMLIYFHRVVLLLLTSPFTCFYQTYAMNRENGFGNGRNLYEKAINYTGRQYRKFSERLGLFWVGQIHSHHLRMFFYRHVYRMDIAPKVIIYSGAEIRNPANVHIGAGSVIGNDAILDGRAGIFIGENVNLSSGVQIWTLQHDYRDPQFRCNPEHYGPVHIGDRAWLGPRTLLLHDVTIGEGSVVAAGAVVTKDTPPYSLVGGVPAKIIGERPQNLTYVFSGSHAHFL